MMGRRKQERVDLATPRERYWLDRFAKCFHMRGPYIISSRTGPNDGQFFGITVKIRGGYGVMPYNFLQLKRDVYKYERQQRREVKREGLAMRGAFI